MRRATLAPGPRGWTCFAVPEWTSLAVLDWTSLAVPAWTCLAVLGLLTARAGWTCLPVLRVDLIARPLTTEIEILDRLAPWRGGDPDRNGLGVRVTQLARLGGFLDRKRDGPPRNLVIWRGLARLTDILMGYAVGADSVGK